MILRAENESLKNDNYRLQAALRNVICPNCGGPAMVGDIGLDEQQLRLENARLREEVIIFVNKFFNRKTKIQFLYICFLFSSYQIEFGKH